MGVLNITPDSFSDGGKFLTPDRAIAQALALQKAGADILDIGAESTRPGSTTITAVEELRRLLPVLQSLRNQLKIPISLDTRKATVAEIATGAGAEIINDVSGLNHDPRLAEVAARRKLPLILTHMRGEPATMQKAPFARNEGRHKRAPRLHQESAQRWCKKFANHPRPWHRLRQKLPTKLRTPPPPP
jgi:dihydropteroate synthase